MTPFFRCAECGDHVKGSEYGECAYCGGDVEIIDGGSMTDIETMDRDALIAEIRRLRRESKMLHQIVDDAIAMAAHRRTGLLGPEVVAHRKCPCGGDPVEHEGLGGNFWIYCSRCMATTDEFETEDEAWAAWDGVEA